MKRKLTTLLLAVCLVATMMPAYTGVAFAAGEPSVVIKIGYNSNTIEQTLTSGGAVRWTSTSVSGFSAEYFPTENRVNIVLNDVSINSGDASGLSILLENFNDAPKVDIEIIGSNGITNTGSNDAVIIKTIGVRYAEVTMHGSGMLNLDSDANNSALNMDSNSLSIKSGTINIRSTSRGIYSKNNIAIDGGTINATTSGSGIEADTLTINNGNVTVDSSHTENVVPETTTTLPSHGITADTITIEGGNIMAKGEADGICIPDGPTNVTINGGNIVAKGTGPNGIGIKGRTIIYGGAVYAVGESNAFKDAPQNVSELNNNKFVSIVTKYDGQPYCVYAGDSTPSSILFAINGIPVIGGGGVAGWNRSATDRLGDYNNNQNPVSTWNAGFIGDIPSAGIELNLNNANITQTMNAEQGSYYGIYSKGNLTINLKGTTNTVDISDEAQGNVPDDQHVHLMGIYAFSNLTVNGSGKLIVKAEKKYGSAGNCYGISADDGDITISNAEVETLAKGAGSYENDGTGIRIADGKALKLENGAILTAQGSKSAFHIIDQSSGTVYAAPAVLNASNPQITAAYNLDGTSPAAVTADNFSTLVTGVTAYDVHLGANTIKYCKITEGSVPTPTYRPSKPTVTVTTGTEGEVGGTTEYDPATKTLKVIPAEGFVIEDILVNGLSVGPKGEISPIYGWDNVEVKFAKDPNAKIEAGVKGTTIKIVTIKSYKYKGKDRIKLTWKKSLGFKVDYYRIYRAAGNGEFKLFYTTKTNKCTYVNTKNVKSGVKYKFKIVGVRTINGEEVTTQVSKWRSAIGK